MAQLGALVVSLEANMARFTSDMGKAGQQTEDAMKKIQSSIDTAKMAITAIAGSAVVGAMAALVKGSIDAADNLRDMSQMTGVAVEQLDGLGFAAGQAGGSLESMVAATGKLNKSLIEASEGNSETAAAFKALGIEVIDAGGKLRAVDDVMADVADQFAKYKDGPEKAALAIALFGKAGTDMIPMLNDGGAALRENTEYAKMYSNQTTELSNAADNFNDTMGKLEVQQRGFANAVAAQVLPVLQQLADGILGAAEESRKFEVSAGVVGGAVTRMSKVAYDATADFKRLGTVIGGTLAINAGFMKGSLDAARVARQAMNEDLAAIDAAQAKFRGTAGKAAAVNPIDALVSKYARSVDEEKALLATRLQMLTKYRNDEQLSDKQYNDAKKIANDEAEKNTRQFLGGQIASLRAWQNEIGKGRLDGNLGDIQTRIDTLGAQYAMVGADKMPAPRFGPGKAQPVSKVAKIEKPQKAEPDQMAEKSAQIIAALKAEEAALGLTGDAQLRYQLVVDGVIASEIDQAVASKKVITAFKDRQSELERNAGEVQQIMAAQMSPLARAEAEHAEILLKLQVFHDEKFENIQRANAAIEAENARHEQVKADLRIQTDQMVLGAVANSTDQLYGLMKQAGLDQTALGKAAFLASKALAVAQIIMNTNVAAAAALAPPPLGLGPVAGLGLAGTIKAMGYASAGITAGLAIAEASAEGGYDIPAGQNPVTQLHEKEMVLPKAQAEVIRGLATGGGALAAGGNITYAPVIHIDSRSDQAQVHRLVTQAVEDGKAELVDSLQRAGRI